MRRPSAFQSSQNKLKDSALYNPVEKPFKEDIAIEHVGTKNAKVTWTTQPPPACRIAPLIR